MSKKNIEKFYEESANTVFRKVHEKIHSNNYEPNTQFAVDVNKLRSLGEMSLKNEGEDLYFKWYLAELDLSEFTEDIKERNLRIMIMSALVAYLSFIGSQPFSYELLRNLRPFAIFYNIYVKVLALAELKLLESLE